MVNDVWLLFAAATLVVVLVLVVVLLVRLGAIAAQRDAVARDLAALRERVDSSARSVSEHERDIRGDLALARHEHAEAAAGLRREVSDRLAQFQQGTQQSLAHVNAAQSDHLRQFTDRLAELARAVEQNLETLRADNAQRLEQMRATVDEKLQATLEQRLGASFKLVSDRLEQVHKGLGEMQTLASGVGDLKRVLSNVKTRGGWGEVQLGSLLSDVLSPGQYAQNVMTRPCSDQRVEYAVRLPGRGDDGVPCWLPIDAKFPLEDWQRLQDAMESADAVAVESSRKALEGFFKSEARKIRDKYIEAPHTTDFAILFVPTEGLFAEAVARPGLADTLQREFRVTIAGPTNLMAMLNSLQLGFRTLAIERRSTEVWRVLGAVKTEFDRFGDILARTKDRLDAVGKTLDEAGRKSTTIARKLRDVEALPIGEADRLLADAMEPPPFEGDLASPSSDGPSDEK